MRDLSHDNGDAESIEVCRRYASMDQAGREARYATIDAELGFKLVSFALRTGQSLIGQTPSDIELALLAAGLAYEHWQDERDVIVATDNLREAVEKHGEAPHLFIERVALLLPETARSLLRNRFCRRLHQVLFADDSNSDFPQHNVFDTLLHQPRLAYLLVSAIEAALQLRIGRRELRDVIKAVWLEQLPNNSVVLTTSKQAITFFVQFDKYHGVILVRFECEPPTGFWSRWIHQASCRKASERFRAVIEGFTAAFTPLAFANADRLTMFKRSTQHFFEWQGNKPLLKQS